MNSKASLAPGPLLVRFGGLPADTMDDFRSDLARAIQRGTELEAEINVLRPRLLESLYQAVAGQPGELRRFLLSVKRDCFNGRQLNAYRSHPLFNVLEKINGFKEISEAEDELIAHGVELDRAYKRQQACEREALQGLIRSPLFVCGLAVASPLIAERSRQFSGKSVVSFDRRDRRLCVTLLRYASRAALKLSPFATLTSVGLGEIKEMALSMSSRLGQWESKPKSLVRVRRHILERCTDILRRHPPLKDELQIVVNNSRTFLAAGRVLYLRPAYWSLDKQQNKLAFQDEALVQVELGEDLIADIEELFAERTWTYSSLVQNLEQSLDEDGKGRYLVECLVDLGYLILLAPWSDDEGYLEKRILRALDTVPSSTALTTFGERLGEMVETQERLLDHPCPEDAVGQLTSLIDSILEAARPLSGLGAATVTNRVSKHDLYQDTWFEAASPEPLFKISQATAEKMAQDIRPIVRLTQLFDHRHELLQTLGQILKEENEGEAMGLLEFFNLVRSHFQDYMKFHVQSRDGNAWKTTWNPLGLETLGQLADAREEVAASLGKFGKDILGVGRQIDTTELNAVLDNLPAHYTTPVVGACLFVQPISKDGSRWMLNRIKEGTGRFASRYAPIMDERARQSYLDRLTSRGMVSLNGEDVEFLDIWSTQGDTLNVHAIQTPKVLCYPNIHLDVPEDRCLGLGDLMVHEGLLGRPEIRDRQGTRFLPVHLGVGYADYMPTMAKFLYAFGPSEMSAVFPLPWRRHLDGVTISERTWVGNLVLHRRSWTTGVDQVKERLSGLSDLQAFEALNRWRSSCGIPERCFFIEQVDHSVAWTKLQPQYLDFSSPTFVELLRAALKTSGESITFVEQLPEPDHFPVDVEGRPRAIEILLDSVAFSCPNTDRFHQADLPAAMPNSLAALDAEILPSQLPANFDS